jgi:hypothetical protein
VLVDLHTLSEACAEAAEAALGEAQAQVRALGVEATSSREEAQQARAALHAEWQRMVQAQDLADATGAEVDKATVRLVETTDVIALLEEDCTAVRRHAAVSEATNEALRAEVGRRKANGAKAVGRLQGLLDAARVERSAAVHRAVSAEAALAAAAKAMAASEPVVADLGAVACARQGRGGASGRGCYHRRRLRVWRCGANPARARSGSRSSSAVDPARACRAAGARRDQRRARCCHTEL